jgi:alginate O-acetyltransferase complex protein AlgI
MAFNTFTFLFFFLAVVVVNFLLPHRFRSAFLLAASYLFYGWWDYRFLSLILLSTVIDFYAAKRIVVAATPSIKKLWLAGSLGANLSLLGFFKYYAFFVSSVNGVAGSHFFVPHIILPVGISFYTFQTMSYTIDVYRGQLDAEKSFIDFAFFVTFFPQLVAGPIVRAKDFLYQIPHEKKFDWDRAASGIQIALYGLLKKMAVADVLGAEIVTPVFRQMDQYSAASICFAVLAFSFQIYADFSGYSDIAIGTARVLGFHFPENFRFPYLSLRPSEFWRRWHISLSTWLKDCLYVPLGGNRKGTARTYVNLAVTMLLGGLWHGAAWTFVLWGAWQGLALIIDRALERSGVISATMSSRWTKIAAWSVTFLCTQIGWLFFRAGGWNDIAVAAAKIAHWSTGIGVRAIATPYKFNFVLIAVAIVLMDHLHGFLKERRPESGPSGSLWARLWPLRTAVYGMAALYLLIFVRDTGNPFIYFQF